MVRLLMLNVFKNYLQVLDWLLLFQRLMRKSKVSISDSLQFLQVNIVVVSQYSGYRNRNVTYAGIIRFFVRMSCCRAIVDAGKRVTKNVYIFVFSLKQSKVPIMGQMIASKKLIPHVQLYGPPLPPPPTSA